MLIFTLYYLPHLSFLCVIQVGGNPISVQSSWDKQNLSFRTVVYFADGF